MSKGYWRRPEDAGKLDRNWLKRKKKPIPADLPAVSAAEVRKYERCRVVASPAPGDGWHEFEGKVIGRHGPYLLVRDQENDVFDVLPANVREA